MSSIPILNLPVVTGLDGTEYVPLVQGLEPVAVTRRATTALIAQLGFASVLPSSMAWTIDGGGGVIPSGVSGTLQVPFNATIQSVTMEADQQGSIGMDIWACTYAQYDPPTTPTVANTITGTAPPVIMSAKKYRDTTLTSWTVTLTQGSILTFYVSPGVLNITKVTLSLNLNRVVN